MLSLCVGPKILAHLGSRQGNICHRMSVLWWRPERCLVEEDIEIKFHRSTMISLYSSLCHDNRFSKIRNDKPDSTSWEAKVAKKSDTAALKSFTQQVKDERLGREKVSR